MFSELHVASVVVGLFCLLIIWYCFWGFKTWDKR